MNKILQRIYQVRIDNWHLLVSLTYKLKIKAEIILVFRLELFILIDNSKQILMINNIQK